MSALETRYRFSFFAMFDYKGIEDNLALMAKKGWEIHYIGPSLWKFKRTNPSDKKFTVLWGVNVSEVENGWKKEIQWKQMQIFSASQDAIPMETDEAVKLDSMHVIMKKTFLPSWILALLAMLIFLVSNSMKYLGNSPYVDEGTVWAILITMYVAFMLVAALLGYNFWLQASRKKIAEGGTSVSVAWYRRLLNILMVGFLIVILGFFAETTLPLGKGLIVYIIIYMAMVLAVVSVSNFLYQYLREKGWPSHSNIILSTTVTIVLIIVMVVITNIILVIKRG